MVLVKSLDDKIIDEIRRLPTVYVESPTTGKCENYVDKDDVAEIVRQSFSLDKQNLFVVTANGKVVGVFNQAGLLNDRLPKLKEVHGRKLEITNIILNKV